MVWSNHNMKRMSSILTSVFIFSMILFSVYARNWRIGDGGLARWDTNCDFNGSDIDHVPSTGAQCGGVCIADARCTHFTYSSGTCHKKRYLGSGFRERYAGGDAVCGWIVNRSGQPSK
ncbi:uncharacterized protein LOC124817195 [Hydra vulgaris]|uniref:uncharacterized protein LOC124817195 n=1 Tax=Hydra vulgaris TaxID=6087 RepID=UPI001F5FF24F|nr:uncharacterized protein LOC124817195 [Hydra vulgaris]